MVAYSLTWRPALLIEPLPQGSRVFGKVPSVIYLEIKPRGTLLNYAHGTANSVDPDRADHRGLSDPGLCCSLWPICLRGSDPCGIY